MCNFYGVTIPKKKQLVVKNTEVSLTEKHQLLLKPVINGFDYGNTIILLQDDDNEVKALEAHWELIPHWINNFKEVVEARKNGIPWLNATSEKLFASSMFKEATMQRRCIVIASHFFEWQKVNVPLSKKQLSIPYAIQVANQPYFFMAGIYNLFKDIYTGQTMLNFALVTTEANELMQEIHNTKKRMPVILNDELSMQWMQKSLKENYIKEISKYSIPSCRLEAFTIANNFKTSLNPLQKADYTNLTKPNTLF